MFTRNEFSLFFLLTINNAVISQSIENVDFRAEGKSIVVTYDFLHPKADTSVNIELQFKDQQGSVITPKTISGDLKDVKTGLAKRIVWNVITDEVILSGKYKAELKIIQYNSVKIGNQVWMTENLNVDRFRNGDLIPEAKTKEEWNKAAEERRPAWCYYENDQANGAKYGKLYNWYAVKDSRGLAPAGYHIPTDDEWTTLSDLLGVETIAGNKMKSTTGWIKNGNGTNSSGFSGLPGGRRSFIGYFDGVGYSGYWWSATEHNTDIAYFRYLGGGSGNLPSLVIEKEKGLSVRCLRD
jgi:uncharacterized protein (TIGR02145 family)